MRAPHAHDVAIGERSFIVDTGAVDLGPVGGSEVDDYEGVAAVVHLGVLATDVGVGQGDGAVGQPADRDDALAQRDSFAGWKHQRRDTVVATLVQAGGDREAPGLQVVVDGHGHPYRAHELKPLGVRVLTCRLAQLGVQRVVDVGKAGVVFGADLKAEVVGHYALALYVDAAIFIHLAQQPPAELDRTNAGVRTTRKHALDHTL